MRRIIGLELGRHTARAVIVERRLRGWRMAESACHTWTPTEDLAEQFSDATPWLQELLARAPGSRLWISLPPGHFITRLVDLPPVKGATLDDLLRYELQQGCPLPPREAVGAGVPVQFAAQATTALLGWAYRDTVQSLDAWLKRAGAGDYRLTLSPCAGYQTMRSVLRHSTRGKRVNSAPAQVLLTLDGDWLELVALRRGCLCFSHSAPLDLDPGLESEVGPAALVPKETLSQIRRAVLGARAAIGCEPPGNGLRMIGVGLSPEVRSQLETYLHQEIETIASSWVPPWRDERAAAGEVEPFSGAFGLALLGMAPKEGLVLSSSPDPDASAVPAPARRSHLVLRTAAVFSGLLAFAVSPQNPLGLTAALERDYERARVSTASSYPAPSRSDSARTVALGELATGVDQDSLLHLEVLRMLSGRLPHEVVVTELSMDRRSAVSLRGAAPDGLVVTRALRVMRETGLFEKVRLSYMNVTEVEGESRTQFELVGALPAVAVSRQRGQLQ